MANEYDPRPAGRFVSFEGTAAPYKWPQDQLQVPNGFGALPIVNSLNVALTGREGFGMSCEFAGPAVGTKQTIILPTPDDGDFWLDSIALQVFDVNNGSAFQFQAYSPGYLQIEDIATGFKLFPNPPNALGEGIPTPLLLITASPAQGAPRGAGVRNSMIQPYCFLRACGIKLTLTLPAGYAAMPPANNWFINLSGWKEYAYAAT